MSEHFVIDEGDFRITIENTHKGRETWLWTVVHRIGPPPWKYKHGRASSEAYAKHDAREAITDFKRELEERARRSTTIQEVS